MRKSLKKRYLRAREAFGFGTTRLLTPESYEGYRETQIAGNKRKIEKVFATEENVAAIAAYAEKRLGTVHSALCHGARNGREVEWFARHLSGTPELLGTDISDTATDFPNCIQWDFHDENPDWIGKWDLIYTNSWDHTFDPDRAFDVWMRCLSPRGLLVLEHGHAHRPDNVRALDPFGACLKGLCDTLNRAGAPDFEVIDTFRLPGGDDERNAVVVSHATH